MFPRYQGLKTWGEVDVEGILILTVGESAHG